MAAKSIQETNIYLVRHGETDWNIQQRLQGREDTDLNVQGRQQANALAAFFKTQYCTKIVSSPLKRAFDTALAIGTENGLLPVAIEDLLIERDYGSGSGLLPAERLERFPDGIPDLEPIEALRQRAMVIFNLLVEKYAGHKLIVVSHGGIINSMLYILSNGETGHRDTMLKNASINKIIWNDKSWKIEYYNKTSEDF